MAPARCGLITGRRDGGRLRLLPAPRCADAPPARASGARCGARTGRLLRAARLLALAALAAAGPSRAQELSPVPGRPPAPAMALSALDGAQHRLAAYRGRVVVINFWATWCPPCRREMPSMERASRLLCAQGAILLAVNVGETPQTVSEFLTRVPVSFPVLLDESGGVMSDWAIPGLPTTFVIDPDGRIVYRAVGGRRWDAPELIEAILALQQPSGRLAGKAASDPRQSRTCALDS